MRVAPVIALFWLPTVVMLVVVTLWYLGWFLYLFVWKEK